ncbi:MAG: HAD family phosphatase [Bacteroidales bacterium]|nr:HAD family phosphatase [Bacteroidales bacterium]
MKKQKPDLKGIKNLIFDFGGVLIDIDYEAVRSAFQKIGLEDVSAFYKHENHSRLVEDFEQGIISATVFRDEIIRNIGKPISYESFDWAWNAILKEVPFERVKLLEKLSSRFNLYLLSNTNIIHYEKYTGDFKRQHGKSLHSLFIKAYFSHEIKMRKPYPDIFNYVIKDAGLEKEKSMFIDDAEKNIEAARKVGLKVFYKPQEDELTEFFDTF